MEDNYSIDDIRCRLNTKIIGSNIFIYDETVSTNDTAKLLAQDSDTSTGAIVISDSQKRGRGRFKREWTSPKGAGIYMSILLKDGFREEDKSFHTIISGLSLALALKKRLSLDIYIKWPNDLILNNKKVGGILAEGSYNSGILTSLIIGIGINVHNKEFPPEIKNIATSLYLETGIKITRAELIANICNEFEFWHNIYINGGRSTIKDHWTMNSCTIGRHVNIDFGGRRISGIASDIDENGFLIINTPYGGIEKITGGYLG